jgi:hypothetical protein
MAGTKMLRRVLLLGMFAAFLCAFFLVETGTGGSNTIGEVGPLQLSVVLKPLLCHSQSSPLCPGFGVEI